MNWANFVWHSHLHGISMLEWNGKEKEGNVYHKNKQKNYSFIFIVIWVNDIENVHPSFTAIFVHNVWYNQCVCHVRNKVTWSLDEAIKNEKGFKELVNDVFKIKFFPSAIDIDVDNGKLLKLNLN